MRVLPGCRLLFTPQRWPCGSTTILVLGTCVARRRRGLSLRRWYCISQAMQSINSVAALVAKICVVDRCMHLSSAALASRLRENVWLLGLRWLKWSRGTIDGWGIILSCLPRPDGCSKASTGSVCMSSIREATFKSRMLRDPLSELGLVGVMRVILVCLCTASRADTLAETATFLVIELVVVFPSFAALRVCKFNCHWYTRIGKIAPTSRFINVISCALIPWPTPWHFLW